MKQKFDADKFNEALWNRLLKHKWHNVSIKTCVHGNVKSVWLECEDCHETILDTNIETLCARDNWGLYTAEEDEVLRNRLLEHDGHDVSIAVYGDLDDPADVCLECEDCGTVILDSEIYTICERGDI